IINRADRFGLAVIAPQQTSSNNPNRCFNWFSPGDVGRGGGEAASIAAMVSHAIQAHDLDNDRVFVTGLSAGGAMAAAMLAAYPDLFAGGAVIAGLPYGVARNVQDALRVMSRADGRPADALVFLGNQGSTQALILRGQALEALGRYEEALPLYLRATANAEGRLGAARLYQRMGRLQEGITLLGDSPAESVLRTELQWAAGQLGEAAAGLEATLPRLGPLEPDYNRALGLLAMIYYGQGDWTKGGWVLRQLSARVGLANELFLRTWPWLLTFLIFLGIVLYGESRIEPMRTIEMSGEPIYGPGTLYVWLTGGLVLAAIVSGWVGFSLYGNWLAIFTPVQSELVRPVFYFLLGAFVLMITYNRLRRHLAIHLGLPRGWIEGLWAGVVLLALLGLYSLVRKPLGLGEVPPMFLTFVGFA
ncbi:MAG: PHB depolymerase family esterase, partial [Meiothermus silvanus]|nr:PHB depolymerase family esterase [Allomeiothermus silvanus]